MRARGPLMVVGLGLIPASVMLLFWNEGRAVQTARSLSEGAGIVRPADANRVDPALDRQLVHLNGRLEATVELADREFGVSGRVLRISRRVEMYQWREQSEGRDGARTTYSATWSGTAIDSSRFRDGGQHQNPPMRWRTEGQTAREARLGARRVGIDLIRQLPVEEPLAASGMPPGPAAAGLPVHVADGGFYIGRNPGAPQVGDYRVTFTMTSPQDVSLIAQQAGDGFAPFQTRAGDAIAMLRPGLLAADRMFQVAQEENVALTWMLRIAGCAMQFFGWLFVLRAINVLSWVPLVGPLVDAAGGLVAAAMTALIALPTIAVAWLWSRPLLGTGLLLAGVALAYGAVVLGRKRAPAPAMPQRVG